MTQDLEIEAIGTIATALGKLEDDQARARVLRYANERFGTPGPEPRLVGPPVQLASQVIGAPQQRVETAEPNFPHFADLFEAAASPSTNVDKALVAGYWLQCCTKQASWTGLQANTLLKEMGHGVGNITTATNSAKKQKPALILQISKTGKAQQGRKAYKLTNAGVARVRGMLGLSEAGQPALADNGDEQGA